MNYENKQDYIDYRIKRAWNSLDDAKLLAKNDRWNTCINRLYYSCFYAVISLLLTKGYNVSTHKGVRLKFSELFIKERLIPKKYGKLYSRLFEWRQKGDYGDLFDFDEKRIKPLIKPVEELISEIEKLL